MGRLDRKTEMRMNAERENRTGSHGCGSPAATVVPLTAIVCATLVALTASSSSKGEERDYPYRVATTVGMVTDIVRTVAGPLADVQGIIGDGVDPHLYKPTRGDVAALLRADVVFYSGLMLEGKMADALIKVGRRGKPVYAVTELLDEEYLLEPADMQGHHDPHVWMDAKAWGKAVEAVARSLIEFDPTNAEGYRSRGTELEKELRRLDAYAREKIGSIPKSQRILITAHDAFNYFGRAYDIEVIGIQGISTESEAGIGDINRLVDLIVDRNVSAVFVETSVAHKNVQALVEGAASRGKTIRIGGELFSDAMGPAGTYEGTYIGMIDHNVTTIVRALGGDAPESGLNGQLRAH
jgi:manganese/zinc/iron transport system substrate-binding protein